jgi:dihydrofolate reductase
MRKVRYGGAISLDGYIAGPNGETDWIVIDPDIDFAAMFKQYDTLLIGRRTFTGMVDAGRGSMPGMQVYVFSTTLRQEDYPDVTMVDTGAGEVVRELRQRPGKDIALFGGASLFRSLLDAGQVDTVEVSLIPVLLGAGVPLMPPPYGPVALRLVKQRVLPTTGTISLEYTIVHRHVPPVGHRRRRQKRT